MKPDPDHNDWQRAGDELSAGPVIHRPLASGELANTWALPDFFEALGPVMRLPPKEKEPEPVKMRAEVAKRDRRPRVLIFAAVLLLVMAAVQAPLLRLLSRNIPVPDEVLGTWSSASQRYADRGFAITVDTLLLQLGPGKSASYPITEVRRIGSTDSARFTIRYRDGSSLLEMELRVDEDAGLQLANLPTVIWRKDGR
jgi:hypothetical protein